MAFVVEIPSIFTKGTKIPSRLGNTTLTGNEMIQGNMVVNGSLTLLGSMNDTDINYQSLDISSTLTVRGDSHLNSVLADTLEVDGSTLLSDVSAHDLDLSGSLMVEGSTLLSDVSAHDLDLSGSLMVKGSLDVTGLATFSGGISAGSEGDAFKIDSSGNSYFYKEVRIGGTVNVDAGLYVGGGDLYVNGALTKSVYNSGEVIQTKCYSSAMGTTFTTSITENYPTTIKSIIFTPKSASSFILVHADCYYSINGNGYDSFKSGININGTIVIEKVKIWNSFYVDYRNMSDLFPLMGVINNTTLTDKTILLTTGRSGSNNTIDLLNINITITEIQQ